MRVPFAQAIQKMAIEKNELLFMTGDLGFMALESVRETLGERFINTGVAEQNMVTMAASLAYEGFTPVVYSISPFVTLRPYEQIRNDVCLHDLPVKIVGNGGGYGYGIMGATHHNLEDIAAMRLLPNMKVLVPCVKEDVAACVNQMLNDPHPYYLRLNLEADIEGMPTFAAWRKVRSGNKAVLVATGPVLGQLFKLSPALLDGLDIWLVSQFPLAPLPQELVTSLERSKALITMEEHKGECGLHEALASTLLGNLNCGISFLPLFAKGYPSGRYGSQQWHLEENSLAGQSLEKELTSFLSKVSV